MDEIKQSSGKTVMITGGAGFLGSTLTDRLIAKGHHVYCVDNLHTGRRANLAGQASSGLLTVIEHDIVEPWPDLPRFDEIYNLACPASPIHYQEDPIATLQVCSKGVMNVLERARTDNARFFHTSTSEIYGDPEIHPQHESYHGNVNTVGPRSCYDEGKRFAETLVMDYSARYGITARMVRIFNTFGPRMQADDGRVVSNFIVQALRGADITIYGDGRQTRSFCYVDDLIDGFMLLMAAGDHASGPMNIGNPSERTVQELAEVIIELTGSRSSIVHRPLPIDDPRRRRPDVSRANRLLNWSPQIDLITGLEMTIEYFRAELGEPTTGAADVKENARVAVARADTRVATSA
jgi:UDP-glucuronate decarboxylase